MATVELRFSALPEHVRTARLVAAAVARRSGVDEAVLDEVRLAVGEACTRAVGLHQSGGISAPVKVLLIEEEKQFSIEVGDEAPRSVPGDRAAGSLGVTGPFLCLQSSVHPFREEIHDLANGSQCLRGITSFRFCKG